MKYYILCNYWIYLKTVLLFNEKLLEYRFQNSSLNFYWNIDEICENEMGSIEWDFQIHFILFSVKYFQSI